MTEPKTVAGKLRREWHERRFPNHFGGPPYTADVPRDAAKIAQGRADYEAFASGRAVLGPEDDDVFDFIARALL